MKLELPHSSGNRRSITGPQLDALCGISRQWRTQLVKRGNLPSPHYITTVSRPRWWLDDVLAALARIGPDAEQAARERAERMLALSRMRKEASQ